MKNRRCVKTIHKKYRSLKSDIWARLAVKGRDNFITKFIVTQAQNKLSIKSRRSLPKQKKHLLKTFTTTNTISKKNFNSNVTSNTMLTRKRNTSRRGELLKNRRRISLFYGGGRIRAKTWRRYARLPFEKKLTRLSTLSPYSKNVNFSYVPKYFFSTAIKTYASIIESRLDVLLFRSNFVDTIYQARQYIFHRKCKVYGHPRINHPGFLVKNYQTFNLYENYAKRLRKSLLTRILDHKVVYIPSYLHVNFSLLLAFKIEDPITSIITYPFATSPAPLANFRYSFSIL